MRRRLYGLVVGVGAQCLAVAAHAGSPTCTTSASTIAFGTVDVLTGAAVDTTGTITVSCTGGSGLGQRLCLSIGSGANVSGSQRQMAGPSSGTLNYELYKDSSRTTPWGSWQTGFDSSGLQVDVAQLTTTPITIYARLAGSQQTAVPGSYSTTFTANPYNQYDDKGSTACPTGNRSSSASTSVTATVTPTCSVTATALTFPSTSVITSAVDATATVQPTCSNSLAYTVALGGGNSGATNPTLRKMSKGAEQVTYGLYQDLARSQPWGSTVGTNTVAGTGTGLAQTLTVYGRVPAQTTGSAGNYTHSVVVTVTY